MAAGADGAIDLVLAADALDVNLQVQLAHAGNDRLEGGPGHDILVGGTGSDIFVNVLTNRDADAIVRQAVHFAGLAPNIIVKIPATRVGIEAMEEATYRGVSINATVSFTAPQAVAVAEAVRKVAYMINVPHAFTPEYPADGGDAGKPAEPRTGNAEKMG